MSHHVIVEFDDIAVWAEVNEPVVEQMRRIHAARSLMSPVPDTAVESVRAWYKEHREQSEQCQRRECRHAA